MGKKRMVALVLFTFVAKDGQDQDSLAEHGFDEVLLRELDAYALMLNEDPGFPYRILKVEQAVGE